MSNEVPPYAILSHTWGNEEVSYQDIQGSDAKLKTGFDKIKRCCEIATSDGLKYAWIDTCCIDKTSSSELSEAINSMYRWYQEAMVCYAYLADVVGEEGSQILENSFVDSRWFTRGWTLQELLAPSSLIFFDSNWQEIGTKSSLRELVSVATNIHIDALRCNQSGLERFSVAQRMSWASMRKTTRVEDTAYCLMGIFNVNMPMLYGEGRNSFIRLQEEIMKSSDDPTIFAWRPHVPADPFSGWKYRGVMYAGLLASSPEVFQQSGTIVRCKDRESVSFTSTNKGINLQISTKCTGIVDGEREYLGVLDCHDIGKSNQMLVLHFKDSSEGGDYRVRYHPHQMGVMHIWEGDELEPFVQESVYFRQERGLKYSGPRWVSWSLQYGGLLAHGIAPFEVHRIKQLQADEWRKDPIGDDYSGVFIVGDEVITAVTFKGSDPESWAILLKSMPEPECLSANIIQLLPDETAKDIAKLYRPDPISGASRPWKEVPDRMMWQLPHMKDYLYVTLRRKILQGKPTFVVDIELKGMNLATAGSRQDSGSVDSSRNQEQVEDENVR